MRTQDPLNQLLTRTTATPVLDKLSTFAAGWKAEEAAQRAEYIADLRRLDWQQEFIDDSRRRLQARAVLNRIRAMQPLVDPDAALFNAARPGRHGDVTL